MWDYPKSSLASYQVALAHLGNHQIPLIFIPLCRRWRYPKATATGGSGQSVGNYCNRGLADCTGCFRMWYVVQCTHLLDLSRAVLLTSHTHLGILNKVIDDADDLETSVNNLVDSAVLYAVEFANAHGYVPPFFSPTTTSSPQYNAQCFYAAKIWMSFEFPRRQPGRPLKRSGCCAKR